jgi:putative oxidoreductase
MWRLEFFEKLQWLGLLAVRVALGCGFLFHGSQKIPLKWDQFDWGAAWVAKVSSMAPTPLLYAAAWTELLAGLGVLLGLLTRWAGVGLCCVMGYAIFVIHWNDPFAKKELAFIYAAAALLLVTAGAGPVSLDRLIFERRGKGG